MANVSFDAKFEKGAASQASPFSYVSNAGTVAGSVGSNSDRVLIAAVQIFSSGGTGIGDITSVAVTWAGNSMTSIGTATDATNNFKIWLFGLKGDANVTTGAQTIQASWSGGTVNAVVLSAWSFFSADGTTGWQNFTSNNGTGTTADTGNVSSANGNMIAGALIDNDASSASIGGGGTSDWNERSFSKNYNGGHEASTGATTAFTWTLGSSVAWITASVDVIAVADGPTTAQLAGVFDQQAIGGVIIGRVDA